MKKKEGPQNTQKDTEKIQGYYEKKSCPSVYSVCSDDVGSHLNGGLNEESIC